MIHSIKYGIFCSLLIFYTTAKSQNPIADAVMKMATDEDLRYGSLSICILDADKDSIIGSYQPHTSLVPASTMKVLTTYAALVTLGPDANFQTQLELTGTIADSILNGNIIIKGGGDPTLGSQRSEGALNTNDLVKLFVSKIKALGIKGINGGLIYDDTYFKGNPIPSTWQWDDIGNYYGAGIHGLSFHDNEYTLYFKQSIRIGDSPSILKSYPPQRNWKIINKVITAGSGTGDNSIIFGDPESDIQKVIGTIPAGNSSFTVRGSMNNPGLALADMMMQQIVDSAFFITNQPLDFTTWKNSESIPSISKIFYTHNSIPTRSIIKETNHRSVNLYAETLMRHTAKALNNEAGPDQAGKLLRDFWKDKGLDVNGLWIEDASGLSPRNGVSSSCFAKALGIAFKDRVNFETFYASLPEAGSEGTVRGLLDKSDASGAVHAKSGSMRRIKSYVGYMRSSKGKWYTFAVVANNFTCSGSEIKRKTSELLLTLWKNG